MEDVTTYSKFSFAADVDGEYKFCFVDNTRGNVFGTPPLHSKLHYLQFFLLIPGRRAHRKPVDVQ